VASRYVSRSRRSASPVFAVLGIATGVLALIVILGVMNGFQMGFIESILEISSYHIRVELPAQTEALDIAAGIAANPDVASVTPFREFHGLIRGSRSRPQAVLIRALPPDALDTDPGMKKKLVFESGSFDITGSRSILLGAELARRIPARVGDKISMVSIAGFLETPDFFAEEDHTEPMEDSAESSAEETSDGFTVTGIFRSGFYEYDLGWGFINIDTAREIDGGPLFLGGKLKNRWQEPRLDLPPGSVMSTWRDYNRAFFGALRTEKLLMFVLVGLIFVVVGLNIFQSQRRAVLERREEVGLFLALGARERAVRLVFVWDGFIIGLTGASLGLGLGLLIAGNIATFFTILEAIVNFFIGIVNLVSSLFLGGGGMGHFAVFSPTVFYLKEIPSRIIPHEVVLIFMFGFLSALLAAWFASGRVSKTRPAEVLRYE
jgi:lipoprotein-releasing system permease protein